MRTTTVFSAAALATVLGCGDGSRLVTWEMEHFRRECHSIVPQLCFVIREVGDAGFGNAFYVQDFDFVWGTEYTLEVLETPVDEPLADGLSVDHRVVRIIEARPVPAGTAFSLVLTPGNGRVVETAPSVFRFYDERNFTCAAPLDCDALRALLEIEQPIVFDFAHPADPAEPLALLGFTSV